MTISTKELKEALQTAANVANRGDISHELSVITDEAAITKTVLPIKNVSGNNVTVWTLNLGGVYTNELLEPELKMIRNNHIGFNYMLASGIFVFTISQ